MIKLFVSDLDGTLLNHNKRVNDRELEALRFLKQNNISLALASGRMLSEMTKITGEIHHESWYISQNGAFIHTANETLLKSHFFRSELVAQVYQYTATNDLVKVICSGNTNFISHRNKASDHIQSRMFEPFQILENVKQTLLHFLPVCKLSYFGEMQELLAVKQSLEQQFGNQLTQFISDIDCLDIMPKGISKGSALLFLFEHLGLCPREVACIGDSFNDISMFEVIPHSYAMNHAHSDVKKSACNITDSVADAIYHMMKI